MILDELKICIANSSKHDNGTKKAMMGSTLNVHSQAPSPLNKVLFNGKTLPEAQRTQGIDSVPGIISTACYHLNFRDNSRHRVNTLGSTFFKLFVQLFSTFFFNFFKTFFFNFFSILF